ncbi:hypothetical protein DAEQUDRAFT_436827 [Daedalea quercina L-15889]|uniref:F-box domain-containing protein n=1 Tax=Daedalea quercina L-15889 TaxID=1314783 RepID=A0A165NEK2_9APHY|nr:hypothetical protein DAEQUDRAFT_436827 [Daedalea quercina L-15889]
MSIFAFPVELVQDVVSYMAKPDILKFAFTCRTAYACAVPSILRDVSLRKGTKKEADEHLRSFCICVLADLPRRASHIRSLTIGTPTFADEKGAYSQQDYALADHLARIISLATGLRLLIVLDAERLFCSAPPQLARAIISLNNLSDIQFEGYAGPHALGVLSEMRSRPVAVTLTSFGTPTCHRALRTGRDRLLPNFSDTLVSLTLVNNHDLFQALQSDVVWPTLKHLTIGGVRDAANLPAFARTFPGVRRLEVYARCTEETVGPGLWKQLECVSLDRPVPICRPVRHIELVGGDWMEEQFGLSATMMAGIEPTTVTCRDVDVQAVAQLLGCTHSIRYVRFVRASAHTRQGFALFGSLSADSWLEAHNFSALARAHLLALTIPVDIVRAYIDIDGDWACFRARSEVAIGRAGYLRGS